MFLLWKSSESNNTKGLVTFSLAVYFLNSLSYSVYGNEEEAPRVTSPAGTFVGFHEVTSRQKREVFAFTGIPYAASPEGTLRFMSPIPPMKHEGIFDATKPAPECLQWDHLRMRGVVGQENCLFLNIYTNMYPEMKNKGAKTHQPVLVFLHAGSWLAGGGAQDLFRSDYFIENDVMVVTINHRLGVFGFLSTEDEHAPGNYGMRDVVRALEWVRENIWHFGGMNETVTVMGSGAGGTTSHFLTLSPLARGSSLEPDEYSILAKAISQSGTAYTPHAISRNAKAQALSLAAYAGCPLLTSLELVNCLRKMDAVELVEKTPLLFQWDEEPMPFGPVIDGPWMGENAFLPDEPFHLMHEKKVLNAPWIAGNNKDDGSFRVQDILKDANLIKQLNSDWDKWGPVLLHLDKNSCKDPVMISRQIRDYYMKGAKFGEASERQFVDMMTDRFFVYPTEKAMDDHCTKLKGDKTWCYRYILDYSGRRSFLDALQDSTNKAGGMMRGAFGMASPRFQNTRDFHGLGVGFLDELLFLFPSPKLNLIYDQEFDKDGGSRVSTHMLMLWSNFIKGGDPTPILDGMPDDMSPWGTWWEPYYPGYNYWMQLNPIMESQDSAYRADQRSFWDSLPLFENRDRNVLRDEL